MRICVWFEVSNQLWGGGNQFLGTLFRELTNLGHEVTSSPDNRSEVVLINSHDAGPERNLLPAEVARFRESCRKAGRKVPIIHRLDGVAEVLYGKQTQADTIQAELNQLSDYTIFQSRYSQDSFAQRKVQPAHFEIIHNGVDSRIFYPDQYHTLKKNTLQLVAVSWSTRPSKGFATLAYVSRLPQVELRFVGRWGPDVDPDKTIILGAHSSAEVAEIMRTSDGMIHAGQNEACSNAILEALACGLPVLYHNSGGNPELAGSYGLPLTDDLSQDVSRFKEQYHDLRTKVLHNQPRFLITQVAQQYVELFHKAIKLLHGNT